MSRPIVLLADSQLLFDSRGARSLPAYLRGCLESPAPRAAYIGAANGDEAAYYEIFEAAMRQMDVEGCRLIHAAYHERDEEYLRTADLILVAGGDVARGHRALTETKMAEHVAERYAQGALLIGVSAGAMLLGLEAWASSDAEQLQAVPALGIVPYMIDVHDEPQDWARLQRHLARGMGHGRGVGLPLGSGVIYRADNSLEALQRPVSEFVTRDDGVVHSLLFPLDEPCQIARGDGPQDADARRVE